MGHIVVGIDDSKGAEHLLGVALQEAAARGVNVRVLHTWRPPVPMEAYPVLGYDVACASEQRVGEDRMAAVVAAAGSTPGVNVTVDVRSGDAGSALAEASTSADLVVIGQRSHGAFMTALVGSATGYVLHHAHCAVLVVPPQTGPTLAWSRVVVGVDGSPGSQGALRWAAAEAFRYGCPLVVLHAWILNVSPVWPIGASFAFPEDHLGTLQAWLDAEVEACGVDRSQVSVQTRVVRGYAAGALLESLQPTDLLVVGSRGHGGFSDLVLGSVASQCVHHAHAAVAVVRPVVSPSQPD